MCYSESSSFQAVSNFSLSAEEQRSSLCWLLVTLQLEQLEMFTPKCDDSGCVSPRLTWMNESHPDTLSAYRAASEVLGSAGAQEVPVEILPDSVASSNQAFPDYQVYFYAVNTVNHGSQHIGALVIAGGRTGTHRSPLHSCLPTQGDQQSQPPTRARRALDPTPSLL